MEGHSIGMVPLLKSPVSGWPPVSPLETQVWRTGLVWQILSDRLNQFTYYCSSLILDFCNGIQNLKGGRTVWNGCHFASFLVAVIVAQECFCVFILYSYWPMPEAINKANVDQLMDLYPLCMYYQAASHSVIRKCAPPLPKWRGCSCILLIAID